ncbi:hypothetical protein D3C77_349520 [compost metagenome]
MLTQHEVAALETDVLGTHDLVGAGVGQHAVLVDPGLVGEGVQADDRLVAGDDAFRHLAQGLGGPHQAAALGGDRDAIAVRAGAQGHDDLFDRGVAGPFADAVDRAFDLTRPALDGGQGVGDGQTQVVVGVRREDDVGVARPDDAVQIGEALTRLLGRGVADGVGHVQRLGARVGGGQQGLGQELRLGAEGVLGRELDVVEHRGGVFHRARDDGQHLVGAHPQLGRAVDRAGGQEDVAAAMRLGRRSQGAERGVDVLLVGARQGGEDRPLDLARHAADAFLVARRGGGEAGLDHVHAQVAQDMGHLQLGLGRHGEARRLFAVAQGGVEDDDAVGIRRRDLGGSGYAFYSGH